MVIINPVADNGALAGQPLAADACASQQPAGNFESLFDDHHGTGTYVAGTAAWSSLPPYAPAAASSASTSASSPLLMCRDGDPYSMMGFFLPPPYIAPAAAPSPQPAIWPQRQAQHMQSPMAEPWPLSCYYPQTQRFPPPYVAPATPFAQPAAWPQPQVQMQSAVAEPEPEPSSYYPHTQGIATAAAAASAIEAVMTQGATKPAPRRRGRPSKKLTTGVSKHVAANRAAPRRRGAPVTNSAAISGGQVQAQQRPEQPANNDVAAVVTPNRPAAPACTNPAAALPDQERQRQLQPTCSGNAASADNEAATAEEVTAPYADTCAPGVRFRPTDQEIVAYLRMKYAGRKMPVDFIKEFDVYNAHPETITATCGESVSGCWYSFSPRNRKYVKGIRPARSVFEEGRQVGFWKSNTKLIEIHAGGAVVGTVTSLAFQLGVQPKGTKTPWKMKEYSTPETRREPGGSDMLLNHWVICKLYYKERARCNQDNKEEQIIPVVQDDKSGQAGENVGRAGAGDEDAQMVPVDQILGNSEQDLCVEDYLVWYQPFPEQ